ncbi:MAG: biotin transporter BioY [Streptosporangiales bacterium]
MSLTWEPTRRLVLADLLPGARVRDVALVAGGAAFVGLAAQIAVPIPGTPVPVTGQTLAVLLTCAALGGVRGIASMGLYALAGVAGVPWFAGAHSGMAMPSFGYVLGFLLAAVVVGELARRGGDRTPLRTAGTMIAGNLAIYAVGTAWLAIGVLHTGLVPALMAGVVPFLLGDAIKLVLAMGALPAAWRLAGRRSPRP